MDLNKEFYELARDNGCCDEWLSKIKTANVHELLELYKSGLDFSIEHPNWFTNRFALENFDKKDLENHKIYINSKIPETGENGVYILKGYSYGKLKFSDLTAATINLLDESDADIYCEDFSHVFIHVYGNTGVNITQSDNAKVFVYKHSSSSRISTSGNVVVRDKVGK